MSVFCFPAGRHEQRRLITVLVHVFFIAEMEGAAMFNIYKLEKKFGDVEVLKSISMHIDDGELVCLIGPSGSGESAFLSFELLWRPCFFSF